LSGLSYTFENCLEAVNKVKMLRQMCTCTNRHNRLRKIKKEHKLGAKKTVDDHLHWHLFKLFAANCKPEQKYFLSHNLEVLRKSRNFLNRRCVKMASHSLISDFSVRSGQPVLASSYLCLAHKLYIEDFDYDIDLA